MTGTRLSTRTELKSNLMSIYASISDDKPFDALYFVDAAELNVTVYFNTRGFECKQFVPILEGIRGLLRRYSSQPLYKRQLYGYLFKLSNELRAMSLSKKDAKTGTVDPLIALKYVADDLVDDYSAFNPTTGGQEIAEQNREILELIKDDLMEMRDLEPFFLNQPEDVRYKFNQLTKEIHKCLLILPQAKDIAISATTAKKFRENFEILFSVMTDMFIPVESRQQPEEETEEDVVQKVKKTGEKQIVKLEKEIPVNLAELERKAKEGYLDGTETKTE